MKVKVYDIEWVLDDEEEGEVTDPVKYEKLRIERELPTVAELDVDDDAYEFLDEVIDDYLGDVFFNLVRHRNYEIVR